ncbi:MAG: PTS sugar transporter subunit IIC [Candidatus Xenobiia bacterium LiM19]
MQNIWNKFNAALEAMTRQRHLLALRDGMIAVVPIILVGSTFLLLGSQNDVIIKYLPGLASSPFGVWYNENFAAILLPYRFTMGMLSIYVAFTIAASLAGQYKLPVLPQGLGAVVAFLITVKPLHVPVTEGGKPVWVLQMSQLGADGLFLAILSGLLTVEISRFVVYLWEKFFVRKSSAGESENGSIDIPPAVVQAFASFLPLFVVATLVWLTCYSLHIDLYNGLITVMKPLEKLGDTMGCVIIVNFFLQLLGVAGIHGISVMNGVFFALWQKFLIDNSSAHTVGAVLTYITAYPFYQWFVWIGGAGATFPLPFLLLLSRNAHMKRIGKMAFIPSLFNVNEPILFGLPVVANPLLAVPFILSPIVCGIVAFYAFSHNMITRPFIEVPWVLPAFLGAPLCTQDGRALILFAVNVAISIVIWIPFLKAYEKRLSSGKAAVPNGQVKPGQAAEKTGEKTGEKAAEKTVEKTGEKAAEKTGEQAAD